jgi:hypothetical protein
MEADELAGCSDCLMLLYFVHDVGLNCTYELL